MFNAQFVKDDIVKWIRNFFQENGDGCNAVIGISGGKDSSVVAALCVEALGKDRVFGVLMPNGEQSDIDSAYALVNHLGIKSTVVNIQDAYYGVINNIDLPLISNQTKVNLPCRLRMSVLYAVSQSINGRVANTCNLSEDWIGYSTRYGDSVGDFSPLSDLTVTEVRAIGHALGLPAELVDKVPADGLCGKTDEDNFGFTYEALDKYIRTGQYDDYETKKRIDELHFKNQFKLRPMPKYEYDSKDTDLLKYSSAELLKSLLYADRKEASEDVDFAVILSSGHENSHNYLSVPRCVLNEGSLLTDAYLAMHEVGDAFSVYINEQETASDDDDEE